MERNLSTKFRSEAGPEETSFTNIYSILTAVDGTGEKTEGSEGPLFDKATLKDLADLLATNLLKAEDFDSYMLESYVEEIEKYSQSQADRVKRKFAERDNANADAVDSMKDAADAAAEAAKEAAEKVAAATASPENAAEMAREKEREEFMEELRGFGSKELTDKEKSKFIAKSAWNYRGD